MKWASIKDTYEGFAWKRLTPHEIDPSVSNGHEFQGVKPLGELIGYAPIRNRSTDYYLIGDDDEGSPIVTEYIASTASWYDSRAANPHRSAEWRLYYPADAGQIQTKCREGDLMVIGKRVTGRLAVMLIRAGTSAEASIINFLGLDRTTKQGRSPTQVISAPEEDIGLSASETLEALALSMANFENAPPPFPAPDPEPDGDRIVDLVAETMISEWGIKLGTCQDICTLVLSQCGRDRDQMREDPDGALIRFLEVAEASYRMWEKHYLSNFIGPLRFDRNITDEYLADTISKQWMSLRQGRVSRAGRMMELFLCEILRAANMRFEWGGRIEGGKLPDFIFPGVAEYENPSFPETQLRILGAKTSFKDRWRQILSEASRVRVKHGVTRDDSITRTIFDQMRAESFIVVMPDSIRRTYFNPPENLISLASFIEETKRICG